MLSRLSFRTIGIRCYSSSNNNFDLIVIGGGSGGLSCSKTATALGARVALVDAVEPSPLGTTWGIGGTCANVGCIPKKLMHQAALVGEELQTATMYGWKDIQGRGSHDWASLVNVVTDRIKAGNWIYRVQLNQKNVKYFNAFASFVDKNTVKVVGVDKKQTEHNLHAKHIVISTGLRPRYPPIPGAELGITSDDLFSLQHPPGKTLVVGGSYVALESAGLLADLGYPVDLFIRSIPLRFFDRDCVDRVMDGLRGRGVNLITGKQITGVSELDNKKVASFTSGSPSVEQHSYDTIIWAIGRSPRLDSMSLSTVGVSTSAASGRILTSDNDETTTDGIFAIGDVAEGRPELTPTAILCGRLLAERLFGGKEKLMDYSKIATTIFTPLEFSTVGLSEEKAINDYGEDKIEVFHSYYTPYEHVIPQKPEAELCYAKVVALREEPRTVLGMHIVGPNTSEIIQGFSVALAKGITFDDLRDSVAVHPSSAEQFVMLSVTKRSGLDPKVVGCCG